MEKGFKYNGYTFRPLGKTNLTFGQIGNGIMRTVSLEKQIAGIINDGQVLRSEEYRMWGETVEIKTIKDGNFKCTVPMGYINGIKDQFKLSYTALHYCFAKGRITEKQCLDMMRI